MQKPAREGPRFSSREEKEKEIAIEEEMFYIIKKEIVLIILEKVIDGRDQQDSFLVRARL